MHRRVALANKTLSRRVGVSVVVLTLLSVGLLVAAVWLFVGLSDSRDAVSRSIREDAVWASFQADREAARLVETIYDAQQSGVARDVLLRFDLLYSRLGLLQSGKYGIAFGTDSKVGEKATTVVRLAMDLTSDIDMLAKTPASIEQRAPQLLKEARAIRAATGELIVAVNAAVNALRVAERDRSLDTYFHIGLAVAGLTLMLVLIVGLLGLQLRHISRTGREMEQLSEKYARSAHDAEAANRAKSAFLANMSHEIRTPLNAIIGMADLLREAGLTPAQSSQLAIVRQAGDVLLDVINDILDYSKLEAGAVVIEARPVALPEIVDSVRSILSPRASAAGLEFSIEAPALEVTVDASRLRQILLNLAGNAIKFTRSGSVRVSATMLGEQMRFEVVDTGPGIAAEQFQRLFRDFSQLDSSSTRSFGGTGLGLAICKRLAEAMGGRIGVISALGQGSTFWFELPVAPVSAIPVRAAVAIAPDAPKVVAARNILVVDDNEVNRQVAGGLLRSLGMVVDCAEDGAAALDKMAGGGYDLVLMDMQMPVLDGIEATKLARQRGDATPIVGLTANAFQADRDACLAAGMNDHVAKPVTRDKLARLLAATWETAEPPQANEPQTGVDVDEQQQAALREELGDALFDDLVASFADDGLRLLTEAQAAAEAGDAARYDTALHTLKGVALTLGFSSVGKAAADYRSKPLADAKSLPSLELEIRNIPGRSLAA